MENSCSRAAANWWTNKIESLSHGNVKNIEIFKNQLSKEIHEKVSLNSFMIISTCGQRSNTLDSIAFSTKMFSYIPTGYEMHISHNFVARVYDSQGKLLRTFS